MKKFVLCQGCHQRTNKIDGFKVNQKWALAKGNMPCDSCDLTILKDTKCLCVTYYQGDYTPWEHFLTYEDNEG